MKRLHPSIYFVIYFIGAMLTYGAVRIKEAESVYRRQLSFAKNIEAAKSLGSFYALGPAVVWPVYWPLVATGAMFDKYAVGKFENEN